MTSYVTLTVLGFFSILYGTFYSIEIHLNLNNIWLILLHISVFSGLQQLHYHMRWEEENKLLLYHVIPIPSLIPGKNSQPSYTIHIIRFLILDINTLSIIFEIRPYIAVPGAIAYYCITMHYYDLPQLFFWRIRKAKTKGSADHCACATLPNSLGHTPNTITIVVCKVHAKI